MRARNLWKWLSPLFGIAISAVLLWLVLRGIPFAHVWQAALKARSWMLAVAACLAIAGNLVRVERWHVLLGRGLEARFRTLFASMMVGYLVNNVAPARLGEIVRIYLLERTTDVSLGRTAASVVLERILEALVLLAAALGLSAFIRMPEALRTALQATGGLILAVAALLIAFEEAGRALLRRSARWAKPRFSYHLRHRAAFVVERFLEGAAVLRNPKRAGEAVGLSVLVWALEGGSAAMVAWALGIHLPLTGALFMLTVISISFGIPSAPGGAGTYEYAAVLALSAFAIPNSAAVELALMLHALMYAVAGILGLIGIGMELESVRELLPWTPKPHYEPAARRPAA